VTGLGGYLLDTNILANLVRTPHGRVRERIAEVGEDAVWTSVVVARVRCDQVEPPDR